MSRGIDPTTHRPINGGGAQQPKQTAVSTISFGAVKPENAEKKTIIGQDDLEQPKKEEKEEETLLFKNEQQEVEACPDLNLELRISPPYQQPQPLPQLDAAGSGGGRVNGLCFACILGIPNSIDCTCSNNEDYSSGSSN